MGNRILLAALLLTAMTTITTIPSVHWDFQIYSESIAEEITPSNHQSSRLIMNGKSANHIIMPSKDHSLPPFYSITSNSSRHFWYYFFDADSDGLNDTLRVWYLIDDAKDSLGLTERDLNVSYKADSENDTWIPLDVPVIIDSRHYQGRLLGWLRIHFPQKGEYRINLNLQSLSDTSIPQNLILNASFLDNFDGNAWKSIHGLRDGDLNGNFDTLSLSYVPDWTFPDEATLRFEVHVNVWFWDDVWKEWLMLERLYQNVSYDDRFFILPREIIYNIPKNGTYALEVTGFGNDTLLFRDVTFWSDLSKFQGQWNEKYRLVDDDNDYLPEDLDYSLELTMFNNQALILIVYMTSFWMDPRTFKWRFLDSFSERWIIANGTGKWTYNWQIPSRDRFRLDIRVGFPNDGLIFSRMLWINAEDGNDVFPPLNQEHQKTSNTSVDKNITSTRNKQSLTMIDVMESLIKEVFSFFGMSFPRLLDNSMMLWTGVLVIILMLNGLKLVRLHARKPRTETDIKH